jgi:hypothetical protein
MLKFSLATKALLLYLSTTIFQALPCGRVSRQISGLKALSRAIFLSVLFLFRFLGTVLFWVILKPHVGGWVDGCVLFSQEASAAAAAAVVG